MTFCIKAEKSLSRTIKGKKSTELCKRYTGYLKNLIPNDVAWEIFFFLFEEKVYSKNPFHSAYDIYSSLINIRQANPSLNGLKLLSAKCVNQALSSLVIAGYVIKSNSKIAKPKNKKNEKNAGRPPKHVYEAESIAKMLAKVRQMFQNQMEEVIGVLQPLQDMEEVAVNKNEEID